MFHTEKLDFVAMSDYPGGVVHVSSSSFCCIAALIGCQMSWHHCTHEEGVAALRKWGNVGTVCCCTVPVVDFEGRYRFGCLSTAKSVKEGIIERDFPPTSKIIEYIYILYWCFYLDATATWQSLLIWEPPKYTRYSGWGHLWYQPLLISPTWTTHSQYFPNSRQISA